MPYSEKFSRRCINCIRNDEELLKFGLNQRTACEAEKLDHTDKRDSYQVFDERKISNETNLLRDLRTGLFVISEFASLLYSS